MCRRQRGAQALRTRKEETMTEGVMNLSAPRGEKNVWDQKPWQLNACDSERWLTAAMGSGLTVLGTRRGGFSGGMIAMLGCALAIRAAMGRHDVGVARQWLDERLEGRGRRRDVVQDASEESFPASDAPAWAGAD
jgi:hypothetical protein